MKPTESTEGPIHIIDQGDVQYGPVVLLYPATVGALRESEVYIDEIIVIGDEHYDDVIREATEKKRFRCIHRFNRADHAIGYLEDLIERIRKVDAIRRGEPEPEPEPRFIAQ